MSDSDIAGSGARRQGRKADCDRNAVTDVHADVRRNGRCQRENTIVG